ncbi:MAG: GTP-binding protein [Polyangiaceae bacterium]
MTTETPQLNIATIGHYSHGKTTVAAAITRMIARRNATSRALRVSDIAKGSIQRVKDWNETVQVNHVGYPLQGASVSHADCPGRRRGLRNTARGLHLTDVAVLVISAEEGIMAQSREHLIAARGAGVPNVVVFINKCDLLTEPEVLDLVEAEAREMVSDCGYNGDEIRVLRGAALPALQDDPTWSGTIEDLIDTLDQSSLIRVHDAEGPVLFAIDHLYSSLRTREGTELNYRVAGMLHRGRLVSGSKLDILHFTEGAPAAIAHVLEMEVFKEQRKSAVAGENVGLVIHVITKASWYGRSNLRRAVLSASNGAKLSRRFRCELRLFTQREGCRHSPIFSGHQPTLYIRHQSIQGQIQLPPSHPIGHPGDRIADVEIELERPCVAEEGMTFSVADGSDGYRLQLGGDPRWGGLFAIGKIAALLPDVPSVT